MLLKDLLPYLRTDKTENTDRTSFYRIMFRLLSFCHCKEGDSHPAHETNGKQQGCSLDKREPCNQVHFVSNSCPPPEKGFDFIVKSKPFSTI